MVLIVYKGPQNWQILPTDLRNSETLSNVLKSNMKRFGDINCQRKIGKKGELCRLTATKVIGYSIYIFIYIYIHKRL